GRVADRCACRRHRQRRRRAVEPAQSRALVPHVHRRRRRAGARHSRGAVARAGAGARGARMKLLWLNAGLLLPLDKGGKLRTWHVMRHLAARHDITYLSFEDPSQTEADRSGMREACARLETVPRSDAAKGTWRFYANAARYVVNPV